MQSLEVSGMTTIVVVRRQRVNSSRPAQHVARGQRVAQTQCNGASRITFEMRKVF